MNLVKLLLKEVDRKLALAGCKVEGVNWQSNSRWEHFLNMTQVCFMCFAVICSDGISPVNSLSRARAHVQSLVGHQYLIDAVAKVKEVHERLFTGKTINLDMLKTNTAATTLINEIVECKKKNKNRLELIAQKQIHVVGDTNSLRLSCRIPILRELVAVGDFDADIDPGCRRPFLALAGYDADPVLLGISKRAAKAADTAGQAAKPRVEHVPKPMSPECFSDKQSVWVRLTPKVSSVWVQNNSMCLDVLDEPKRSTAMPPNSESFHAVIIDLPYGLHLAEWDVPFSRDQVRCVCCISWFLILDVTH